MQEEIIKARLNDYKRWVTPTVTSVLKGVEKMCLDHKRAREIPLEVNANGSSFTDGRKITVSLMHSFLDPKYSETYWMVAMKAITAHECQHINSSSIKRAQKTAEKFGVFMNTKYGFNKKIGEKLAFDMINIIEDGRIENIIVTRMPGMKINFLIVNGEIRGQGRIFERAEAGDSNTEFSHFRGQILSYAKSGGNLPGIEAYKGTRLEKEFENIRDDIDAGVRAYSCGDCCKITQRLLEKIAPYINDLLRADSDFMNAIEQMISNLDFNTDPKNEEFNEAGKQGNAPLQVLRKASKQQNSSNGNQQEESENGNSNSESDGSDDNGKNSDPEEKSGDSGEKSDGSGGENGNSGEGNGESGPKQDKSSGKGKGSEKDGSSDTSDSSQNGDSDGENKKESHGQKPDLEQHVKAGSDLSGDFSDVRLQDRGYTEEELRKAEEIIRHEVEKATRDSFMSSFESGIDNDFVAQLVIETGKRYSERVVLGGTERLPAELEAKARQLKQEMIKILKTKHRDRMNTKKGIINPNALWKLRCKEDNLFQMRNKRDKSSVAIYLLIDNSGSMGSAEKSIAARMAAAVIEEAFSELAACKIALFAAGVEVVHWIIKSFDKKSKYNASFNSLCAVSPYGGNRDGYSIRIATQELKKRNEKKKVLIVLSDGLPSDYIGGANQGKMDVRAAVEEARKNRIEVFSIMYGDVIFQREQYKEFLEMYGRNVIPSDSNTIIKNLTKLFKSLVA